MRTKHLPFIKKVVAVLYCCLIVFLSHQPTLPVISLEITYLDKIFHIIEYAVAGILFFNAWGVDKPTRIYIFLFLTFFAMSDEIHQLFVLNRQCSVYDFVADIIGIGIVYIFLGIKDRKKSLLV